MLVAAMGESTITTYGKSGDFNTDLPMIELLSKSTTVSQEYLRWDPNESFLPHFYDWIEIDPHTDGEIVEFSDARTTYAPTSMITEGEALTPTFPNGCASNHSNL